MMLGARMPASSSRARVLSAALLVILLLFARTVELMHVHADGAGHTDCALCQSAHNFAQPLAVPQINPVSFAAIRIVLPARREYREHLFSYSHWNKPPPDRTGIA